MDHQERYSVSLAASTVGSKTMPDSVGAGSRWLTSEPLRHETNKQKLTKNRPKAPLILFPKRGSPEQRSRHSALCR